MRVSKTWIGLAALPALVTTSLVGVASVALAKAPVAAIHRAPAKGGSITDAFGVQPDTLNPAQTGDTVAIQIDRNIFDSLVYETPQGSFKPWLATSWTITNGGKTYTFQLRKGVTFQDGTPFNAAAVVYNINYILNPKTHSIGAIGALGPIASAKATGAYTVVFQFKTPYAPFLTNLASPELGPQSPTAIQKWGAQYSEHVVGTGPFELTSYTSGTGFVLKRNPHYDWAPAAYGRNGPAYLNQITYEFTTSPQVAQESLQTGQAQILEGASTIAFKDLKGNPAFTAMYVPINGAGVYAPMDVKASPTNDLKVRQAILYAINRQGVEDLADQGQYQLTWGPIQKGTFGYDPAFNGMYSYNPAKAAKLLESDGYKKVGGWWTKGGKRLSVQINLFAGGGDFDTYGTAMQGYLEKFGIQVTTQTLEQSAWTSDQIAHKWNITPLQFSSVDPDVMRLEFGCGQYFDWIGFCNPTLDKLLNQGLATTNTAQRLAIYWKAETIVMNNALIIPIRLDENLDLLSSKLKGVTDYIGGDISFYNAYLAH